MTRFTPMRLLLVMLMTLLPAAYALAAGGSATFARYADGQTARHPSRLAAHERFRSVRVAPGGPSTITDAYLEQLKRSGFNTVLLSDIVGSNEATWKRVAPETIDQWLTLARKHGISVIAVSPFVEPLSDDVPPQVAGGIGPTHRPSTGSSLPAASASVHAGAIHALSADTPTMHLRYLSDEDVFAALRAWQLFSKGEVIAITPFGDDPFYLGVTAEKQLDWARIEELAAPDIPRLGMIGEFALTRTSEESRRYWAPSAFSFFALIMYPYNLGSIWGRPLNHLTSADPDDDLARYIHDYVHEQDARFLFELQPSQTVIPVIQTFAWDVENAGIVPRITDIHLQARLIHYEMQTTLRQRDNYAMAYFYLGSEDQSGPPYPPRGIEDMPGWPDAVAEENARMEQAFRNNLPAVLPRRRGVR
jgi:hypothetical protein